MDPVELNCEKKTNDVDVGVLNEMISSAATSVPLHWAAAFPSNI